jgi:uncharacterized protein YqhQ
MFSSQDLWVRSTSGDGKEPVEETTLLPFHTLLQRAGLGIKLRFLLAMFVVAFLPVLLLALAFDNAQQQMAGRNIWLVLAGILLLTVLVAIGVALPVVRPIRRATRQVTAVTEGVRRLAIDAQRIAQEHHTGTAILSGVSRRLIIRQSSMVRDSEVITRTCAALQPRLSWLLQQAQEMQNQEMLQLISTLLQGMQQITFLSTRIKDTFERDTLLEQLEKAMKSAEEISMQFDEAGQQLARELEVLERASAALI